MPWRKMFISALILGLFAVVGTGLVALTRASTAERIADNERQSLLDNLHQVLPKELHDNDLYSDAIMVTSPLLGTNKPVAVYRARKQSDPVAVIIASMSPLGYGGPIKMLVGIRYDGNISGVRVLSHKETPGLGDGIEIAKSDWILGFNGLSLIDPKESQWKVKKDGGVFDQFTGATITPRNVVATVLNTLRYYKQNRDMLFAKDKTPDIGEKP